MRDGKIRGKRETMSLNGTCMGISSEIPFNVY